MAPINLAICYSQEKYFADITDFLSTSPGEASR